MSIIYNVTINSTTSKGTYHIQWEYNSEISCHFDSDTSEIMPEEMDWMYKDRRNQLQIGEKLFLFLNSPHNCFNNALKHADDSNQSLQINLFACHETTNWPFELLVKNGAFLLPSGVHLVRHVIIPETCEASDIPTPSISIPVTHSQNRPLKILFMASVPINKSDELDFENEEDAIYKSTEELAIEMDIEDTGSLDGLRKKLEQQTFDIIHISGFAGIDKSGEPYFVLEDETGNGVNITAEKLWMNALSINPPQILFLSGSSTGSNSDGKIREQSQAAFAQLLVGKYHIPSVLGWGQWINDIEASEAAKMIYKELSRGQSITAAVQRAQHYLYKLFTASVTPSWPQLRLFSNEASFQAIVTAEQERFIKPQRMSHSYLRNTQVKVLIEGFVGRRRQLQIAHRTLLNEPGKVGLIITGIGGLGKSCLAGKIIQRFADRTLIIIHGKLDSLTLKQALKDAFFISQDETGIDVLNWEMELKEILGILSRTCLKNNPYLILLDDFEQNFQFLEKGKPGPLFPEAFLLLKTLLDVLPQTQKSTQLMITSRYEFSLHVNEIDLIKQRLQPIYLTSFRGPEQSKKVIALPHLLNQKDLLILNGLLEIGCGNPRLMEWIDVLVGEIGEKLIPDLLQAAKGKKQEFIQKHVIDELLNKGGRELNLFLHWFGIFRRPVSVDGVKSISTKIGLNAWEDVLEMGMRMSLIEHDQSQLSYQVTPLLREQLLNELENHHGAHEAAFAYYKSICEGRPGDQFNSILVEEWVFHALGCNEEEVASEKGCLLVKFFKYHNAFLEAQQYGLWILDQKKRELATQHDASLLNSLGAAMSNLGNHKEAIERYQKALSIWEHIPGEKRLFIATALNNIGTSHLMLGQHQNAIRFFNEAISINEKLFGRKHSYVSILLNNLGECYQALGDYPQSIVHLDEALSIDLSLYGKSHSYVAGECYNLGTAWFELGDYTKAIGYFNDALSIDKQVSNGKSPRIAKELDSLGSVWLALGEAQKSFYYFQEALTFNETLFGWQHPNIAQCLNNMGGAWDALGKYEEAIKFYQEALNIDLNFFDEIHPNIATRKINLGNSWRLLGYPQKALSYFEEALKIDKKSLEKEHPNIARDLNSLGVIWQELGKLSKSRDYFLKALQMNEKIFGHIHPSVSKNLNNLGTLFKNMGKSDEAMSYYADALNVEKSIFGENHPNVAVILNNMGMVWKALNKQQEAIDCFEKALEIDKQRLGENHPNIARHMNNLGMQWKKNGNPDKALSYLLQALYLWRKAYSEIHPNIAIAMCNLGDIWRGLNKHKKAISLYQMALAIDTELLGKEHPDIAFILNNLGCAYYEIGQLDRAKTHFSNAYEMYKKIFGVKHPETISVKNNLFLCESA